MAKVGSHPMMVLLSVWRDCRRDNPLWGSSSQRNNNSKEVLQTTHQSWCSYLRKADEFGKSRRFAFSTMTTQDCMLQTRPYRRLASWKGETFQHPPYSPDLTHSDFNLFQSLYNLNDDEEKKKEKKTVARKLPHNFLPTKTKFLRKWPQQLCIRMRESPLFILTTMYSNNKCFLWVGKIV